MNRRSEQKRKIGDRFVFVDSIKCTVKSPHSPITLLVHRERTKWKILPQFESRLNLKQDE